MKTSSRQASARTRGVFNNAGQDYNHIHFWKWMKKDGGGKKLPSALQARIDSDLGGYDKFRTDFIAAGVGQFGSGWAWLTVKNGKLEVTKTPNGENPLVHGGTPILGVDVWEHSDHIDYRKRSREISRGVRRPSHQLGVCRGAAAQSLTVLNGLGAEPSPKNCFGAARPRLPPMVRRAHHEVSTIVPPKPYDIIVFGASSFVGQLVCGYLASHFSPARLHGPPPARIA